MEKLKWDELKSEKKAESKAESKKKQSHFMSKEIDIDIKINPKKILKGALIIVLFSFIFFLGRWSDVECTSCVAEDLVAEEAQSSGWSSFLSSFTGFFVADTEELIAEEIPVEEEVPEEPVEEVEEEILVEEVVEEVEEEIITDYSKVSFAISAVKVEWHDTWGKVTDLVYTIKNSEEGTIKPDHFMMMVEGYTDESSKKDVPLPLPSQTVRSKTSVSSSTQVPGGFNYHSKTAGNLDDVEIRFIMFDFDDKPIASYRKTFNLER
ncbi:hypothetical protein GOV03_01605 [Candidatus Woesearchaeota archaeon]|nr:hypothetical protein [Candidatus Woesearchaeota archaeon]